MFDYVSMLMLSSVFFSFVVVALLCVSLCISYLLRASFAIQRRTTYVICAVRPAKREKLKRHEAQDILAKEKKCRKRYNCGDSSKYIYFLFARLHVSFDPLNVAFSLSLSSDFPLNMDASCCWQ